MLKLFTSKRTVTVKIEKPCSEDWDKMRPVQGGRHCDVCAKRVTDFSGMSGAELARFAKANGKICGRINSEFLNKPLVVEEPKKGGVLGLLLRAAVLVGISSPLQVKAAPAYTIHHNNIVPVDEPTNRVIRIRIKVVDKATGLPLPNAKIGLNNLAPDVYLWQIFTDTNGYLETNLTIKEPTDLTLKVLVKSHFYRDKTVEFLLPAENEMSLDIELDKVAIPARTIYGVYGDGHQYADGTLQPYGICDVEISDYPKLKTQTNANGEYMITIPDSIKGNLVVFASEPGTGNRIGTQSVIVLDESIRVDFPLLNYWFPNPPIIESLGGTSILEYKWEWKIPCFNIGDLTIFYMVQSNWSGTEIYVRTPFPRRNLPLYKSHWFRGE